MKKVFLSPMLKRIIVPIVFLLTTILIIFSIPNPRPDTDGDGVPDWWMVQYFGHNTGQIADKSMWYQDKDGDGLINIQEFIDNSSPITANAVTVFLATPRQYIP